MKKSIHKINVRTIRKLNENDGLTLKNGKKISYLSGWQVAVRGDVCYTPEETMKYIREFNAQLKGNERRVYSIGIWVWEGKYYIDISKRVPTRTMAFEIGKQCEQLSVFNWNNGKVIFING